MDQDTTYVAFDSSKETFAAVAIVLDRLDLRPLFIARRSRRWTLEAGEGARSSRPSGPAWCIGGAGVARRGLRALDLVHVTGELQAALMRSTGSGRPVSFPLAGVEAACPGLLAAMARSPEALGLVATAYPFRSFSLQFLNYWRDTSPHRSSQNITLPMEQIGPGSCIHRRVLANLVYH
jgi:hypothetical protein